MPKSKVVSNVYPRSYVRKEIIKQTYSIANVLASDEEYDALIALRKKQGDEQMENYKPPLVRGCGLPKEQKRKRKRIELVMRQRERQMLWREKKYKM